MTVSSAARDPRWELNLAAVDAIPAHRRLLRLARWLIPLADDPEERQALGVTLLERLRFSTAETRNVAHLLGNYPVVLSPVDSSAGSKASCSDFRHAFQIQYLQRISQYNKSSLQGGLR